LDRIFAAPPHCEALANIKKGGLLLWAAFLNIHSVSINPTLTLCMTNRQ
jgi:hypothetical protein